MQSTILRPAAPAFAILSIVAIVSTLALSGCAHHATERTVASPAAVATPSPGVVDPTVAGDPADEPDATAATEAAVEQGIPSEDPEFRLPYTDTRYGEVDPGTPVEVAEGAGEDLSDSPLDVLGQVTPVIDEPTLIAERALVEAIEPEFDIPMVTNDKVLFWINYYSNTHRRHFLPGLERSGRYVPMFRKIFREEGLPQDLVYMAHVESAYKTNAYSRAKAMGVWQFIASTGRRYNLKIDYWVDERRDPEKAARAAAKYLKKLYGDFGDWYLAMAAYNGGEGRIGRALSRSGLDDFWGIAKTRHIRRETKNYVPAILAAIQISKNPEKFGMSFLPDERVEYDSVDVEGAVDLQVLADCAGSDYETLRTLNPALRRQQTPPNATTAVRVPVGSAERTLVALADVPQERRVLYVRHRVRKGDTLYDLARAYGVTVGAIQQTNGMGRRTMINAGKELVIPTIAAGKFATSRKASAAPASPGRAPASATGETLRYRVRRGDTLSGIAARYRTTARAIAAASGISVNKTLHIGDRLTVVSGVRSESQARALSDSVAEEAAGGKYTVRRGDSLWRIANRFRTSVDQLCALNGISKNGTLYPGTQLTISP